jgi:hypothetical protein
MASRKIVAIYHEFNGVKTYIKDVIHKSEHKLIVSDSTKEIADAHNFGTQKSANDALGIIHNPYHREYKSETLYYDIPQEFIDTFDVRFGKDLR